MASAVNVPEKLKPYVAHGVRLDTHRDLTNATAVAGDCPWCGREGKFNVTIGEGLWRCVTCNIGSVKGGGNVYTFLRVLHDLSMKATVYDEYKTFAAQMKLLYPETLKVWGLCRSVIDNTWIVPGYSVQNGTREGGKIVTMYRYIKLKDSEKPRFCVTSGLSHGLMGPDIPTPTGGLQTKREGREKTGPVYRLEGLKDAMAFYEIALRCKPNDEGGLSPTSNPEASLLHQGSVIAVPGAGTFFPQWANVLANRPDYSFYHNDHPKERPLGSGRFVQAALDGTQKAIDIISHAAQSPKECQYLRWGESTFHDPNLPSGYDVRDHLSGGGDNVTLLQRIKALNELLYRLQPIPQEWLPGREMSPTGITVKELECRDWKTLMNAMRAPDVLKPTPGIIRTFAAGLASILSVPSYGDQLWLMVIGPPSSAKSTLCEAWSANRQYVLPKDTLTGLFSGWQMGLEKDQNLSLAGEMQNKTLVIKDGDTVLQSPQLNQIMSQLRALYDRCVRTQYKNRMSKDWEGLNSTVILCGTATLLQLDAAERGARYLTVDIQPNHDYDLEDEIALRVAHRSFRNMTIHANGKMETRDSPEMARFKQLTAGYISYLRQNATALIESVEDPDGTALKQCVDMATFISYMRCRPPKKQNEKVEREMPYRLTSQLVRLARGLAVVFNKSTMDKEVMDHVRHIGLDTAGGTILGLCDHIRAAGKDGITSNLLSQYIGQTHDETLNLLRFMKKIRGVELYNPPSGPVRNVRQRWMLAPRLAGLYDRIFGRAHGQRRDGRVQIASPEIEM